MDKSNCTIPDCAKPVVSRGWCGAHYERWRSYGDPQFVRVFKKDLQCSAPDCERTQRVNGYCELHDRRVKKYGDPNGRRREMKPCAGPECDRLVSDRSTHGLCPGHYKQRQLGKPLAPLRKPVKDRPKVCTFPDCGRPRKSGGHCAAHVLQLKRNGELRPIRATRPVGVCDVADCDQTRITAGYCERHYSLRVRRWAAYGITPEAGAELYAEQAGRCPVCEVAFDIDELVIDHDHACCPSGTKGCGNCVRGLLCGRCNKGLGYFEDNAARLSAAARYVDRH